MPLTDVRRSLPSHGSKAHRPCVSGDRSNRDQHWKRRIGHGHVPDPYRPGEDYHPATPGAFSPLALYWLLPWWRSDRTSRVVTALPHPRTWRGPHGQCAPYQWLAAAPVGVAGAERVQGVARGGALGKTYDCRVL